MSLPKLIERIVIRVKSVQKSENNVVGWRIDLMFDASWIGCVLYEKNLWNLYQNRIYWGKTMYQYKPELNNIGSIKDLDIEHFIFHSSRDYLYYLKNH